MTKLVPLTATRTPSVRLAASAVAVAAAVAGTAGVAAGQGTAPSPIQSDPPSHVRKAAKVKHPKLKHGELRIEGSDASDKIALRLEAGDPATLEVDIGDDGSPDFAFEHADIAAIAVNAGDGNDVVRIDETNGAVNAAISTTLRGGDGDDTLAGGSGAESLLGGDGNDSIDGNRGSDVSSMGDGDDTFVWDPGDGSDVVEGQDGADTMLFNGAGVAEQVDLSANGSRLRFFRNPGNITMDTAGVERVDFAALGGSDVITVNDLSGTGVSDVNVDLAGTLGGAAGDGQADRVAVNGTNGDDKIDVSGDAEVVKVSGLAASTRILHSEVANDRLEIDTLAGTDAVDSSGLAVGAIQLVVDGVLAP